MIVTQDSAILDIPNETPLDSNRDHRTCCKFATREYGYDTISDGLDDILLDIFGQRQRPTVQNQASFYLTTTPHTLTWIRIKLLSTELKYYRRIFHHLRELSPFHGATLAPTVATPHPQLRLQRRTYPFRR